MSEKQVAAVLLPTTAYILKLKPPPARDLIEKGKQAAFKDVIMKSKHYILTRVVI